MTHRLASADNHHRRQTRIVAAAIRRAREDFRAGDKKGLLRTVAGFQTIAATEAASSVPKMLQEQGIDASKVFPVVPSAFGGAAPDGRPLTAWLKDAGNEEHLARLVGTIIQDAGRSAAGVATAVSPFAGGYIRALVPPSCARCAILAGHFYRWNKGFARHTLCDCKHVPTNERVAPGLVTDRNAAFRNGQIVRRRTGKDGNFGKSFDDLSAANRKAIADGADMRAVVNPYRKASGLQIPGQTIFRRGDRLTPAGIYRQANDDRAEAIRLLKKFGYIG